MRNTWRPRKSPQLSQSLSGSDEGASEGSRRLARRRPSSYFRVALVFAVLLGVLLLIACFPGVRHPRPPQESVRIDPFVSQSKCNDVTLNDENYSGFSEEPVDSTVLMLYTPTSRSSSGFCYSDGVGGANTTVEQEFLRVAASYVASPYAKPSSPYYDFFRAHDATLWTVDRVARVATPMRLDIAYTYVNPSAPSFERHLKMRNVPFEQRRYRDWEELRYSLRSLRAFMLDNDALAQHHRRHAADVRRLGELGYRVDESDVVAGGVVPLVRRVYLIVSDVDQVPEWLDTEKFPQLRVVTHRDMFTAEEAAWVLPTMNSNVIESGMHRIPGISRFILYFTNDMFVGRNMSFFDLFRPLSPLRQRLHLYSTVENYTSFGSTTMSGTDPLNERSLLLFEPVVHSDTQNIKAAEHDQAEVTKSATRSGATEVLHSCFYQRARQSITSNRQKRVWSASSTTMPSYATKDVFALPDPHQQVGRGSGVSMKYFHFIASQRINGVQPPFGYAHIPQLVDREVYRRLNEVELFDLTNVTRAAYEREMSPFGVINLYAIFAAAMARAAERHIWNTVWRAAPEHAFADVREELQTWWLREISTHTNDVVKQLLNRLSSKLEIPMFGALYGDTWGAQLQRPDLALEMGYWWVRNTMSPAHPARQLGALKQLYAIPEVSSEATCHAQPADWSARSDDHYQSLLLDMFHHTKRDSTFLFEMVDSEVKTMLIAARLKYEWVDRPLFMGFNDNFLPSANYTYVKVAFRTLMKIVAGNAEAAMWER